MVGDDKAPDPLGDDDSAQRRVCSACALSLQPTVIAAVCHANKMARMSRIHTRRWRPKVEHPTLNASSMPTPPPVSTRPPHALLIMGARHMYEPAAITLETGLRAHGYTVSTKHLDFRTFSNAGRVGIRLRAAVVNQLRVGDAFFWIGFQPDYLRTPGGPVSSLAALLSLLTAHGVFTVHYETEPLPDLWRPRPTIPTWSNYTCRQLHVQESWHYARSNVARCREGMRRRRPDGLTPAQREVGFRYMPPGFSRSPLVDIVTAPRHLLFIGSTQPAYQQRRLCLRSMRSSLMDALQIPPGEIATWCLKSHCFTNVRECNSGPCPLRVANHLSNNSMLQMGLSTSAFFLNVHKRCNVTSEKGQRQDFAAEAFRLAPLLSSGAVVISERSDPRDEVAYRGLVEFAEVDDIGPLFARMWSDRSHLATAAARAHAFERAFAPSRLFANEGASQALMAHRTELGARIGGVLRLSELDIQQERSMLASA